MHRLQQREDIFMKKRICNAVLIIVLAMLFLNSFVVPVKADHGPKPSIDVKITNAPAYKYMTILHRNRTEGKENSTLKMENLDKVAVEAYIESFYYDGWEAYLCMNRITVHEKNESDSYSFGYMVPTTFKVLLIAEDGTVIISPELSQKEFNAECEYDVANGTLTEKRAGKFLARIIYILGCLAITLVIEFIVLLLFCYPLTKTNITAFFAINLVTQLALNIFLAFVRQSWSIVSLYIFIEILIALVEGIFYAKKLRRSDGEKRPKLSFLYGVFANALSFGAGLVIYMFFKV